MPTGQSFQETADFGGAYHTTTVPTFASVCVNNSFMDPPGCGCPAPSTAVNFLLQTVGCGGSTELTLCWNNVPSTTFGGAYLQRIDGNNECYVPNPTVNACACPEGSNASAAIPVVREGNAPSCNSAKNADLVFCYVPPSQ
jgi:hypothetical protein